MVVAAVVLGVVWVPVVTGTAAGGVAATVGMVAEVAVAAVWSVCAGAACSAGAAAGAATGLGGSLVTPSFANTGLSRVTE